jgi:hypothetical protein
LWSSDRWQTFPKRNPLSELNRNLMKNWYR